MNKKFELCTGLEEKRNFFPPGLYHNIFKSSSPNPFPQLLRFEEKSNPSELILKVHEVTFKKKGKKKNV